MLVAKQKITNQEFLQATVELEQTINKNNQSEEDAEMDCDNGGEGYETYSEEDLSDEDLPKKKK